jgi:CheY-like chemotaxis protein
MRLLCADDEEDIRTILQLALSLDPELEVELVDSGEAALARARTQRYDAIVLDGMMPGLDGYETCRRQAFRSCFSPRKHSAARLSKRSPSVQSPVYKSRSIR